MMSSYGFFPTANQMAPLIDDSDLAKPLTLKLDEPASISVRISGFPRPAVRWQIGRKRIKESPKFHMVSDGDRNHTLEISRVTRDLEQGLWVVATNVNGEDCCLVEVRTYEIVFKPRHSAKEQQQQSVQRSSSVNRTGSLQKVNWFSNSSAPIKRGASILSLKDWKEEMAIRNKMRSVDDLAFKSDKASLMSGLGYSLSVDIGDSDDPDLDEQFHSLSRHRRKRPLPVTTTRLIFPEVEPSRLAPCPNSSYRNASIPQMESVEDKTSAHPEQMEGEDATQNLKRSEKKRKKRSKTLTSVPDLSTVEATQVEVEMMVTDAQNFSDMPGPRWTSDEDVWRLCGGKLSEMCRKMLERFPPRQMRTLDLNNTQILETFEDRDFVEKNAKDLNDNIRATENKAINESVAMQLAAKHKGNKDNDEVVRVKRSIRRAKMPAINEDSIEMTALSGGGVLKDASNSGQQFRIRCKKTHSLSLPLANETEQQDPVSDSNFPSLKKFSKSSPNKRNKRKRRPELKHEIKQERTVHAEQDNSAEATNNDRTEENLGENYNKITDCKVLKGGTTKMRSKKKKRGNQRSFESAAKGKQIQKETRPSKKAQNKARTPGQVEHKTSTSEENEAIRTFVEKEAIFAVRSFAEIEARTSEKVKHKARTPRKVTEASTSVQKDHEANTAIGNEVIPSGQAENQKGENDTRVTHEKVRKKSEKRKSLGKPEQNKAALSSEFSSLPENSLHGSNSRKKLCSSELTVNANDSGENVALVLQENSENCPSIVAPGDFEYACTVSTKPVAKKKIKKQKTRSKAKVLHKSGAGNSKKRKELTIREDLRNQEDLRDQNDWEDFEILSDEELIIQMDREPRSGARPSGEINETVNAICELDRERSEKNVETTRSVLKEANMSKQVENKVDSEAGEAREDDIVSSSSANKYEEQIILMNREPRSGIVRTNGNQQLSSWLQTAEEKRSAGLVSARNTITSQSSPRQNSRKCASIDQITDQTIMKGNIDTNEDFTEVIPKDVQRQEVGSGLCGACTIQRPLERNGLSALKAEELNEHGTSDLPNDNGNLSSNFGIDSSAVSKPELKNFHPSKVHVENTYTNVAYHDAATSVRPEWRLVKMESHIDNAKRKKNSEKRNSETAVEFNGFEESDRVFSGSSNSSGHLPTVRNERKIIAPNLQFEMKTSIRPSLGSSLHMKTEPNDLKLSDPNSKQEILIPSLLNSSPGLNTFAKNPDYISDLRAKSFENNVQSNLSIDVARYRLPQEGSATDETNVKDPEKIENTMTSDEAVILKALVERIRSGQVEIIIINKKIFEEEKKYLASDNPTSLLNVCDASEKVDAAEAQVLMKTEEPLKSTKGDDIRFIDSDDSGEILETNEQTSKVIENLKTVSNEKHIDLSETKLDLSATKAQLPGTKVDLPGTRVGIPGTKLDLVGSKVGIRDTNLDLPETSISVCINRQESKMKVSQKSGTLDALNNVSEDIVKPGSPYNRRDIALNRTKETHGTSATMPGVTKTPMNMKVNNIVTRTQTSGKMEQESNQNGTVSGALPQSMSVPAETSKPNSTEVGIAKLNPPKPKPRETLSYSKSELVKQDSTKQPAACSIISAQSQHKLADENPELDEGDFGDVSRPKPRPKAILPFQNISANFQLRAAKDVNGVNRLNPQIQPQPAPRTKLPTKTDKAQVQLSNHVANLPVLDYNSSLNQQVSSDGSDVHAHPATEATAKKASIVREILAKWNDTSFKAPSMIDKKISSETQLAIASGKNSSIIAPLIATDPMEKSSTATQETTASGKNSPISSLIRTVPVEKSSATTGVAIVPIRKSSKATQVSMVSVEKPPTETPAKTVSAEKSLTVPQITAFSGQKSSTATHAATVPGEKTAEVAQASEKNSSLSPLIPTSNIGPCQNTTSENQLKSLSTMADPFAKITSPVKNVDGTTFVLDHHYPPFRRYVSAPQYSSENAYRQKFDPWETNLLRHQAPALQDGRTESAYEDYASSKINTTAQYWASNRDQLCHSNANAIGNLFQGNRAVVNDQVSVLQNRCSKEKEISEEIENEQNVVDDRTETSTLSAAQSRLPSRNNHFFADSKRTSEPTANDAGLRNEQPISSNYFSIAKDLDSDNSTRTQEALIEDSEFETNNNNEKETAHYHWSTKPNKGEYVSTVVTHEYSELITLYPAT